MTSDAGASPQPKRVTGLLALCAASIATLLGGFTAHRLLAGLDPEGFFGDRFFFGPPLAVLMLALIGSGIALVAALMRPGEASGAVYRRGPFIALALMWVAILSMLSVAGIIVVDPYATWSIVFPALSLPYMVISAIIAIPLVQILPGWLRRAGLRRVQD